MFYRFCLLSGTVKQKSSDSSSFESLEAYFSVIKIGFMRLPKHPCISLTFLAGVLCGFFIRIIRNTDM